MSIIPNERDKGRNEASKIYQSTIEDLKQEVEELKNIIHEHPAELHREYNNGVEDSQEEITQLKQEVEELKRNSQEDYKSGFANGEKDAIKEITQLKQQLEESKRENERSKGSNLDLDKLQKKFDIVFNKEKRESLQEFFESQKPLDDDFQKSLDDYIKITESNKPKKDRF